MKSSPSEEITGQPKFRNALYSTLAVAGISLYTIGHFYNALNQKSGPLRDQRPDPSKLVLPDARENDSEAHSISKADELTAIAENIPPMVDLDEVEAHEDLLSVLLQGGTIFLNGKYLRIHQEDQESFSLAIGFGFDEETMRPGQLYEFVNPSWQQSFRKQIDDPEKGVTVSYGPESELLKVLKTPNPEHVDSRSVRISVDNALLKALGRDQMIVPKPWVAKHLRSLASRFGTVGIEDVDVVCVVPDGSQYGEIVQLRFVGEYDPVTRKKIVLKETKVE